MTTSTRQTVRELMLDRYGLGRRGTNTGTSQTAITDDAKFGGPGGDKGLTRGNRVMITSGTGAPADEFSRLNSLPVETTGTFKLDPGLSAALADGDTFEVLFDPFCFEPGDGEHSVHEAIVKALALFPWERRLTPVTIVPDGDMRESDVTSWGTASSASAAKTAASFPLGERVITVTASGANGYQPSSGTSIPVEAGETYYLEATGFIDSSSSDATDAGKLILYDLTNSAAISLDEEDITHYEPTTLVNPNVEMPSGCEKVEIRLESVANGDIISWANVIFRKNESRRFVVQDRPTRVLQLGRLLATREDTWGRRTIWDEVPHDVNQLGSSMWEYQAKADLSGYSVWYEEYTVPATMDDDADTTTIPADHLAAVATERLLFPLRRSERWADTYTDVARDAAKILGEYKGGLQRVVNRSQRRYPLARV